jgi:hypothetical protein
MWSRSLALALLLLPAPALAGVEENVAALTPQGLVFVMDARATSWWPRTPTRLSSRPQSPKS